MWSDIELLTNDDTGSGYLSVGSRKEHGTALYQVDLLAKVSSEKVMIMMLFLLTHFLPNAQQAPLLHGKCFVNEYSTCSGNQVCLKLPEISI